MSARDGDHLMQRIAKEVGVSARTVYRALNERSSETWGSAAERSARIRELAAQYGYKPNLAARSTRTQRFQAVGLLIGTHHSASSFPLIMLKGLLDGLTTQGYSLVMSRLPDATLGDGDALPDVLRSLMIDGLLIYYTHHLPPAMATSLGRAQVPQVWLNLERPHDCLRYDDHAAAVSACERLLALGHRRIAYVAAEGMEHYSASARLAAFRTVMGAARCPALTWLRQQRPPSYDGPGTGVGDDTARWLAGFAPEQRPTAIIGYSLEDALAAHHAATMLGLGVPRDLSLVTFTHTLEDPLGFGISRLHAGGERFGRRAGDLIVQRLGRARRLPAELMPYTWWEGRTLAPPPDQAKDAR